MLIKVHVYDKTISEKYRPISNVANYSGKKCSYVVVKLVEYYCSPEPDEPLKLLDYVSSYRFYSEQHNLEIESTNGLGLVTRGADLKVGN